MTHCRDDVCQPATENQGSEGQSRTVGDGIKRINPQSALGKKRKNVSLLLKDRYRKVTATSSQDTFLC